MSSRVVSTVGKQNVQAEPESTHLPVVKGSGKVQCQIAGCRYEGHILVKHLREEHGLDPESYLNIHSGAPIFSEKGKAEYEKRFAQVGGMPRTKVAYRKKQMFSVRDTFQIDLDPETDDAGNVIIDPATGKPKIKDRLVQGFAEPTEFTPTIKPEYVFPKDDTLVILMGFACKDRILIHGATGVGKTSIVEQIAARLNYSVVKINFDGCVTRNDLIGEWIVKGREMQFQYGILPLAFRMPGCVILLDEWDTIGEETAFVIQRPLQKDDGKLLILETGGELVSLHEDNLIIACLVADTLVTDHDGVPRQIVDVVSNNAPVLCVDWSTGKTLDVFTSAKIEPKNKPVIRVRTASTEFVGTFNHPVFAMCPEGITEVKLEDLEPGMSIVRLKQLPEPACAVELQSLKMIDERSGAHHMIRPPDVLDESLAQLLGYLIADGSFVFGPTTFRLSFKDKDKQLIQYYMSLVESLFMTTVNIFEHQDKNSNYAYVDSKRLGEWILANFPELLGGKKVRVVPEKVWKSNNIIVGGFLRGFFDGDGNCSVGRPACTGTNSHLMRGIGLLLQRLGIGFSRDCQCLKSGKSAVRFTIAGQIDRKDFLRLVGFSSVAKQDKLVAGVADEDSSLRSSRSHCAPIPWVAVNRLLDDNNIIHSHVVGYVPARVQGTRVGYSRLVQWYEQAPCLKSLFELIMSFSWDLVLEVELAGEADVYDVSVPIYHNFVANGLVMHNTGNTFGQGDESGLYSQGTRIQNYSQLNRFGLTIKMKYMEPDKEKQMIMNLFPELEKSEADAFILAVNKVRDGHDNGQISVPLSPRDLINWVEKYLKMGCAVRAATYCFLNRMSSEDSQVTLGILQRAFESI